ncbi:hypothetical protein COSO111634_20845 [Corallococcus soli]
MRFWKNDRCSGAWEPETAARASGGGSALRSTLPTGVSGRASSDTNAEGTRGAGNRAETKARSTAASTGAPGTYQATSRGSPEPSSTSPATAAFTDGCWRRRASTSLNSMRKPRSFTCVSMRPRKSSVPSGRQRALSPVR